jgi:signal peptidase I
MGRADAGGRARPPDSESTSPLGRRRLVGVLGIGIAILAIGAAGLLIREGGDDANAAPPATYPMAGVSMEPTLRHGDTVTAREIDGDEVGRGDVVVIELPDGGGDPSLVVKRVVAVAGDEVASVDDELRVNGAVADEPYLAPGTPTVDVARQEVPAGHVFVMGDNRPNSRDSRAFGPVTTGDVVALVDSP